MYNTAQAASLRLPASYTLTGIPHHTAAGPPKPLYLGNRSTLTVGALEAVALASRPASYVLGLGLEG